MEAGITNPNEELFKDGTWVWSGSKWIKAGILLTYSSVVCARKTVTATSPGVVYVYGDVVPAGVLWLIQAVHAIARSGAPTLNLWALKSDTYYITLGQRKNTTAWEPLCWAGTLLLEPGCRLAAVADGQNAGYVVELGYWGYTVKTT